MREPVGDLEDFFENGSIGLHLVGKDGTILRANKAELAMMGYRADEYVGRDIREFHVDADVIEDILARLARGETLRDRPARLRTKSGEIKHVLIDSSVHFRGGEFVNTRCFTRDVTSARHADEVQARYAAIVASSDDAIISIDRTARVTSWNRGAELLYGHTEKEAIGREITFIMAPNALSAWPAMLARCLAGEPVRLRETERVRKDGERRTVSLNLSPLRDPRTSAVIGVSGIARDVTDRKLAEHELAAARQELARSDKLAALGSLVAGVAHEIRTPLTSLITGLSLVERRAARTGDPTLGDIASNLVRDADRIAGLVDSLRRFTRMEVGHKERASLDRPVTEAVALFQATHKSSAPIDASLLPTPEVLVDAAQVQQVVLNLLENAADACAGRPMARIRVRVGADADLERAHLVVEDDGVGIEPPVRARMFDPLFTTKPNGSGLGLAIVKRIADEHDATITCESTPGVGTRFALTFAVAR